MTRIISGRFRGRRLAVPAGTDIRPTTDRMRERLFSILNHSRYPAMAGAQVADLFAGTGALGLEALSRGAEHATFVEQSRGSIDCLRSNIKTLKTEDQTTVIASSVASISKAHQPFEFIFLDPPYRKGLLAPALNRLIEMGWLKSETTVVCELAADDPTDIPVGLTIVDDRKQGKQRLLILMQAQPE